MNRIRSALRNGAKSHSDLEGALDIMFLVVNGVTTRDKIIEIEAPPNWHSDQCEELMTSALECYEDWGGMGEYFASETVATFVRAGIGYCTSMSARDSKFAETAILTLHPLGATCLGYSLPRGQDANSMRKLIFDALKVKVSPINKKISAYSPIPGGNWVRAEEVTA